jgi:hypothetical protein
MNVGARGQGVPDRYLNMATAGMASALLQRERRLAATWTLTCARQWWRCVIELGP